MMDLVDLVNLMILLIKVVLVILVILDFPVIWLNLVDLVSSHFWDFCILLDGIKKQFGTRKNPGIKVVRLLGFCF